ncbi:MBL fold metallo-hydrolase [uncultured Serinicoccus sp.]|uniref:MBL fold metallo-hydrolase n=1 Tax=uncultured Serinicoccus sp. TaxID=735514 RepID=UPI00260A62D5|nr:MBL fold metallo-hydrolase [uncultured Serinicoccus sp.]
MLQRVTDDVLVHQSELLRNNTVVVRGPSGVLLVDPGVTDTELRELAQDLRELGGRVTAGFATHPDWDHVLWHPDLGDAPRFGTARCASSLRELRAQPDWRTRVREGLPPEIVDEVPLEPFGLVTGLPQGAIELPWEGPAVRVLEHPAHSPGHAALLVVASRVLVVGDMLSDVFVPMLDEAREGSDPVEDHLAGLRVLESVADDVDVVVPGHGSVARGPQVRARIDLDRAYLHALREGLEPDDPRIGPDVPAGWEWVRDIHTGQARGVAQRRAAAGSAGEGPAAGEGSAAAERPAAGEASAR